MKVKLAAAHIYVQGLIKKLKIEETMNKVLLLIAILCMACSSRNLVTKPLPEGNPTSYIYSFPLEVVKSTIAKEFSHFSFYGMDVITASREVKRIDKAAQILSDPVNQNDFYLHKDGRPFYPSPIYTDSAGKGYPYYAEFHLHLIALDNARTMVKIITYESMIEYGKSWFSWHDVGRVKRAKKVKPTTVEEYEILQKIDNSLGMMEQMPPLKK